MGVWEGEFGDSSVQWDLEHRQLWFSYMLSFPSTFWLPSLFTVCILQRWRSELHKCVECLVHNSFLSVWEVLGATVIQAFNNHQCQCSFIFWSNITLKFGLEWPSLEFSICLYSFGVSCLLFHCFTFILPFVTEKW